MKAILYEKKDQRREDILRCMAEAIINLDIPKNGTVLFGNEDMMSNDLDTICNLLSDYFDNTLFVYIRVAEGIAVQQPYVIIWA